MSERPTTAGNGAPAEAIEPIRSGTLRPTIRDVARAASVSVGTVSKALNNNGSLRQETRERVIAAAKALGFRPNDATDDPEREAQHVESPALVTGANKGIGHEVARQLGSMGFHVLVGARNSENGQRTTEALRKTGATATFISLDVSDPESIGKAVHLVSALADHLDVLVNNAGVILEGDDSITQLDPDTEFSAPEDCRSSSSAGRLLPTEQRLGRNNPPANQPPNRVRSTPDRQRSL